MDFIAQIVSFLASIGQPKINESNTYTPVLIQFDNRPEGSIEFLDYVKMVGNANGVTTATVRVNGKFKTISNKQELLESFMEFNPKLTSLIAPPKKIIVANGFATAYGLNSSEGLSSLTATGGTFDPWNTMEAAFPYEMFDTYKKQKVFVRNLKTNKVVQVKITDNGPLDYNQIDMQGLAAQTIGNPDAYPGGPGGKIDVEIFQLGEELTIDKKLNILIKHSIK
jgi:rare lipoprotein A (peptidoglycan hydrolase)